MPDDRAHGGLADGGATATEIAQQPAVWRELAARLDEHATAFVADVARRPGLRVILTGAGTSAFAGQIVAPALRRHLGCRVEAVATTDIVAAPRDHLERHTPTLLVSFARSGSSPESVATTMLVDDLVDDVWHVVLTCDPAGALARRHTDSDRSLVVLMPERTNDTGFAMTSSVTSMMLTALLLLGPADQPIVAQVAAAAEQIAARRDAIAELAFSKRNRFVYLGSGALAGLARESALKLLELTAGEVVSYSDTALGFRHGPKAVLDRDTLAVVFVSTDAHTRRYDLDIAAELRRQLGEDAVVLVGTGDGEHGWSLPTLAGLDDSVAAVGYLVFAQYLALFTSLAWGKTPDDPFPSGEVNRVVQGVTIHPLRRDDLH